MYISPNRATGSVYNSCIFYVIVSQVLTKIAKFVGLASGRHRPDIKPITLLSGSIALYTKSVCRKMMTKNITNHKKIISKWYIIMLWHFLYSPLVYRMQLIVYFAFLYWILGIICENVYGMPDFDLTVWKCNTHTETKTCKNAKYNFILDQTFAIIVSVILYCVFAVGHLFNMK